jgi:hypothetical protein
VPLSFHSTEEHHKTSETSRMMLIKFFLRLLSNLQNIHILSNTYFCVYFHKALVYNRKFMEKFNANFLYILILSYSSATMIFKYKGVCICSVSCVLQVTQYLLNSKLHKMNRLYYFMQIKHILHSKDDFLNSRIITQGATWLLSCNYTIL